MHLYSLYNRYRDTLQAHGLFIDKCKELMPIFNNITKRSKFDGVAGTFNEVAEEILPYTTRKIKNVIQFGQCFDTAQYYFTGFARDYLLSHLMYDAYKKRIPVGADYEARYYAACSDKTFKKLIHTIKFRQEQYDKFAVIEGDNSLLDAQGKISTFESIIAQHKGKLIVIDFWATWCAPCKEDMPYLRKMMQEYSEGEIAFIKISLDREIQVWHKAIIAADETDNSYLMLDWTKSSFIAQFDIPSIPRYMIFSKEGKIINPDAPGPSDPELKEVINQFLGK